MLKGYFKMNRVKLYLLRRILINRVSSIDSLIIETAKYHDINPQYSLNHLMREFYLETIAVVEDLLSGRPPQKWFRKFR